MSQESEKIFSRFMFKEATKLSKKQYRDNQRHGLIELSQLFSVDFDPENFIPQDKNEIKKEITKIKRFFKRFKKALNDDIICGREYIMLTLTLDTRMWKLRKALVNDLSLEVNIIPDEGDPKLHYQIDDEKKIPCYCDIDGNHVKGLKVPPRGTTCREYYMEEPILPEEDEDL